MKGGPATAGNSYSEGMAPKQETWTLDNLERIGGHPVQMDGSPRILSAGEGSGPAAAFDGIAALSERA